MDFKRVLFFINSFKLKDCKSFNEYIDTNTLLEQVNNLISALNSLKIQIPEYLKEDQYLKNKEIFNIDKFFDATNCMASSIYQEFSPIDISTGVYFILSFLENYKDDNPNLPLQLKESKDSISGVFVIRREKDKENSLIMFLGPSLEYEEKLPNQIAPLLIRPENKDYSKETLALVNIPINFSLKNSRDYLLWLDISESDIQHLMYFDEDDE